MGKKGFRAIVQRKVGGLSGNPATVRSGIPLKPLWTNKSKREGLYQYGGVLGELRQYWPSYCMSSIHLVPQTMKDRLLWTRKTLKWQIHKMRFRTLAIPILFPMGMAWSIRKMLTRPKQQVTKGTESKSGKSNTKGNNPSLQSIPSGITENALAENDKASESDLVNTQENSGNALATATNNNAKVAAQTNQDSDPVKNEMETLTETEAVAQNQANKQLPAKENGNTVLNNEIPEKEKEIVAQNDEAKQDEKQSIFDVIAEQEEEVVAGTNGNKWSIGPTVAPVYFSASGEGSPVHSTFASNSKSGNVDLSYGLTVAYEVGKKLKIRTGVHRVNYGYDTNDVVFTSSLDGSVNLIDNINYSSDSQNIVLESKNKGALSVEKAELASDASAILDGKMIQNLGYLEIPLELNYSLIDKKFGVDLIGGLSSLFLVDNAVLLESEGLVTEVGEANNVNTTNFSTNIGVGFNYQFSPKVQLNLEPMFKYQLNTFSDTAGSFRPFSVGVYSGFSFKF